MQKITPEAANEILSFRKVLGIEDLEARSRLFGEFLSPVVKSFVLIFLSLRDM